MESCQLTDRSVLYLYSLMDDSKSSEGCPFTDRFDQLAMVKGNSFTTDSIASKLLEEIQMRLMRKAMEKKLLKFKIGGNDTT